MEFMSEPEAIDKLIAVSQQKPAPDYVLIWCFVCKDWISAWRGADSCPRCGNDEIQHDEDGR